MKKISLFTFTAIALLVISGCSSTAKVLVLNPEVKPYKSVEGNDTPLSVVVSEQRVFINEEDIVNKEAQELHILTDDNTLARINSSLTHGLEDRGFKVVPLSNDKAHNDKPLPELAVSVAEMRYTRRKGFWHGVNEFKVVLEVELKDDNKVRYQRRYRALYENHVDQKPSASYRTHYANVALSKALNALFGDSLLLAQLTVDKPVNTSTCSTQPC